MIDTFDINLLAGGFSICTPQWNKSLTRLDQCFKLYVPVKGEVSLYKNDIEFLITEKNVYFISGYNLTSQVCQNKCEIYWIHFLPKSLFL